MIARRMTSKQVGLLQARAREAGLRGDKAILEFVEYTAGCGYYEKVEDIPAEQLDTVLRILARVKN